MRIAGKEQSAGALAEYVNLVWLIPAMDGLFTGPASERRRFLDRLVLAVDPKMRSPLGRYDRAMRQRNRLFQMREGSPSHCSRGSKSRWRKRARRSPPHGSTRRARLVALIERMRAERGEGPFPWAAVALEGRLEAALSHALRDRGRGRISRAVSNEGRERDRAAARALEGPHLSDLIVMHGPKDAPAAHCSSGEQKALLVGLILAKSELIKELEGVAPLVLLDEVAAHLDEARREALFGQILALKCPGLDDRDGPRPVRLDRQTRPNLWL